eukprot:11566167-Alexandrium_andersonii.AAC.1
MAGCCCTASASKPAACTLPGHDSEVLAPLTCGNGTFTVSAVADTRRYFGCKLLCWGYMQ